MRIKLLVEYDGSAYCGWQAQENGPSIQGELEAALKKATGEERRIIGAGRTDAGVHALGQCAHFDTQARIPADKFSFVFNRFLPPDIRVKSSCQVPEDFHARKSAKGKHYRYAIYNGQLRHRPPNLRACACPAAREADVSGRPVPGGEARFWRL